MELVEVFADISCPFTHVGLHRLLDERAARGGNGPRFRLRAWPLELVNGAPLDGAGVAEKAAALREQVAPGLFARLDSTTFPATTRPALALAHAAYRVDDATGEAVSMAIRDALFEFGQDVADPEVLDAIAADHGIGHVTEDDRASVEADWAEGQERGVVGSPHFFAGDLDAFCPTLSISRPDGRLHIEMDNEAFDAFTARVFPELPTAPTVQD